MRYSTTRAIALDAHVARNRELIKDLPRPTYLWVWDPATLSYVWAADATR